MDFGTRYDKLNQRQKDAVNQIYGPLLVIAGPGTGKTELLSMRAANILRKTDALPSSILCLTFTDSGANNMRQRLSQIIGEDAYKVAINTFHSFGTEIINQHRQYFFRGADMKPTDDLTSHQIIREIFDDLDWQNPLKVINNDSYVYLTDVQKAISEFKQSGLSPDELRMIAADNQNVIDKINPMISQLFAERISKNTVIKFAELAESISQIEIEVDRKLPVSITPYQDVLSLSVAHAASEAIDEGSTKPITAWKKEWCEKNEFGAQVLKDSRSAEKLQESINIYEKYQEALGQKQLFDYDDMILSVLSACEANPDLRANLIEQYQFIMVDEFQDTNQAQLRLLFALTGEGSEPNIMAVGDDDQAIFSFQGADIGNIQRFRRHYDNPPIIVLSDNYRSNNQVLVGARSVITQGQDRLENSIADLSKELIAHSDLDGEVILKEYQTPVSERSAIAKNVKKLIDSGVKAEDIAIIARRHNELVELLPHLQAEKITVNYERYDDVFEQQIIQLLELLVRTIISIHDGEHDQTDVLLRDLISHPALDFQTEDIWKLSLIAWRNRTLWLEEMLLNPTFSPFANWLIERGTKINQLPLEQQIDELLGLADINPSTETSEFKPPFGNYFFAKDKLNDQPEEYLIAIEALRTIRDALKSHFESESPDLNQFISLIELYKSTGSRLANVRSHVSGQTGAVNLMSAHKSKGLEFKHVYVIGATDSSWGEKARSRSRLIRYPANLKLAPAGASYDERLRLFFVAMTRAKTHLNISYAKTDLTGKDTLVASFLSAQSPEAQTSVDNLVQIEAAKIDWSSRLSSPITPDLKATLAPILENYKLSVTHLNNFLDVSRGGPQTFLLNNLLRFPQAKSASASYGTAIHSTLQYAHNIFKVDGSLPQLDDILSYFTDKLKKNHLAKEDFDRYLEQGQGTLRQFIEQKRESFTKNQLTELSFAGQGVAVGSAQLTGALDLVDLDKKQKTIFVTDYKTGKPSASWQGKTDFEKIKLHKYRQQLMFYQLLAKHSRDYAGYDFIGGRLQFVEPDKRTNEILSLEDNFSDEELANFSQLIEAVWKKIINLDLPDISKYEPTYKGMLRLEQDLIDIK